MGKDLIDKKEFYDSIKSILQTARDKAYKSVNFIMVEAYWNIRAQIVEDRAKYGTYLIKELSKQLTQEFGKGFSQQNLRNMKQFYKSFPICSTLCSELSWSIRALERDVLEVKMRRESCNE